MQTGRAQTSVPCCWPSGSAGSPQCARPMGGGLLFPVPRPPYVRACVRCRRPLGACSPVCVHGVFCVFPVRCPGPLGSCSPVFPLIAVHSVCSVLGLLAPVHRCDRSVHCVGPCGVVSHSAPVHLCARSVCWVACVVSCATWLLFAVALAQRVVLRVRCPRLPGSCSQVFPAKELCCVCAVLGHLAPVRRCARSVSCVACAVSRATWLLFNCVLARCVALRVRCPGPMGPCSVVWMLGVLGCVCRVLGHLAPVRRCVRLACCVVCAVSWITWLLFTGALARCVVSRVRCPGPLGACRTVCLLGALHCLCGVLGHLAPVPRCARSVCCVACAVSRAIWLLFAGVYAWRVVLRVRCPGPLGSCSPVCTLGALCCVCGVLGHLAPVHQCASSVSCVA